MHTKRFDSNNYEFNSHSKIGVYLIHGFSSTTYEVKFLAKFLAKQGYHVIANNLPGHGTTIDDCNRTKYSNWLSFTETNFAKLVSESDKVYVIGCSMGSILGLYLASKFPINGLVLGGAHTQFKQWFSVNYLNPLFCYFLKKSKKHSKIKEIKFYGYSYYPLIALNQFKKLLHFMSLKYVDVVSPTLIIHGGKDNLATYENSKFIYNKISSENKNIVVMNKAHHNLFDKNPNSEEIHSMVHKFIQKH